MHIGNCIGIGLHQEIDKSVLVENDILGLTLITIMTMLITMTATVAIIPSYSGDKNDEALPVRDALFGRDTGDTGADTLFALSAAV